MRLLIFAALLFPISHVFAQATIEPGDIIECNENGKTFFPFALRTALIFNDQKPDYPDSMLNKERLYSPGGYESALRVQVMLPENQIGEENREGGGDAKFHASADRLKLISVFIPERTNYEFKIELTRQQAASGFFLNPERTVTCSLRHGGDDSDVWKVGDVLRCTPPAGTENRPRNHVVKSTLVSPYPGNGPAFQELAFSSSQVFKISETLRFQYEIIGLYISSTTKRLGVSVFQTTGNNNENTRNSFEVELTKREALGGFTVPTTVGPVLCLLNPK